MKIKPRTSHAPRPNELVEVMNRSLQEYPLFVINGDGKKQYRMVNRRKVILISI